jgi:hypothetical protein
MDDTAAATTAFGMMTVFFLIFAVAAHLFFGYCFKRIAERSGQTETGIWWVPIANYLLVLRAAGKPGWWLILMLIPFVNLVVFFIVWLEVARVLGHGTGWGVVAVLIPIIGVPFLAFADAPQQAAIA